MSKVSLPEEVKFNPGVPKHSKAFLLLSNEMGILSRRTDAAPDWKELDRLCQRIFIRHGYDLQTGSWFCLIQLRLAGWRGVAKSLELLASALSFGERHGSEVADLGLRRSACEWLIGHVLTPIYTLSQSTEDGQAVARCETALTIISRQAKKLGIRGDDRLENLCYFLQVKARISQNIALDINEAQQIQLVCSTPSAPISAIQPSVLPIEEAAEPPVLIDDHPQHNWRWFSYGLSTAAAIMILWGIGVLINQRLFAEPPVLATLNTLEQVSKVFNSAGISSHSLDSEQLKDIDRRMRLLAQTSPTWLAEQVNELSKSLDEVEPDNLASASWRTLLAQSKESLTRAEGWFEIQNRLNSLEARLLESESKKRHHITISELKTEVYEIKRALSNMDTPVSVKLGQLDKMASSEAHSQALQQEIETQLNGLSRAYISVSGK